MVLSSTSFRNKKQASPPSNLIKFHKKSRLHCFFLRPEGFRSCLPCSLVPYESAPSRRKLTMEHHKAVSLHPLFQSILVLCCLCIAASFVSACSSMSGNLSGGTASVTTMISDPATCATPNGPFSHVYVTITDVKIHTSPTAGANDSGWVDLTPELPKAPKQL